MSERIQGAMAHRARTLTVPNDTGLFHVTLNAVLLTVCGHGTPGVRARDAVYPNKPERYVLRETINVEERRVRVDGAKREAVILECKSTCFHVTFHVTRSSFDLNISAEKVDRREDWGERDGHVSNGLVFSPAPSKFSRTFLSFYLLPFDRFPLNSRAYNTLLHDLFKEELREFNLETRE